MKLYSKKMSNKINQMNGVEEINESLYNYYNEFYDYFNNNIFEKFSAKIKVLIEDKCKNNVNITNSYNEQIKDLDILLKTSKINLYHITIINYTK